MVQGPGFRDSGFESRVEGDFRLSVIVCEEVCVRVCECVSVSESV